MNALAIPTADAPPPLEALAVLAESVASKRKLPARNTPLTPRRLPGLTWDPVRPLTGTADWLTRVRLGPGGDPGLQRHFRKDGSLRTFPDTPAGAVSGGLAAQAS